MSTRKQRELLRQRRLEFDRRVEENRTKMMQYVEEQISEAEKKKRGRPKKKVD